MVGHITYMSDTSMAEKFGRQKKAHTGAEKFTADFEVEGYLHYRGDNFVKRFDANSYLYITKAMDNFDAAQGKPFQEALRGQDSPRKSSRPASWRAWRPPTAKSSPPTGTTLFFWRSRRKPI
jgi:homoserine acetyltransferase